MKKIKVAIAEDHAKFRASFLKLMEPEHDLEFIIEAENGVDLLKQLKTRRPDVILMDINMPLMDGLQATREILKKYPEIKVIAFTQFDQEQFVVEMSKLGVKSFIHKNQTDEIPKAIKIVYDGGVYYPDRVAKTLSKYLSRTTSSSCPFELSENESDLLQNICKGLSSTKIAKLINKSPRTVEKYRNELYRKFEVGSKEQLIVKASKWALIN